MGRWINVEWKAQTQQSQNSSGKATAISLSRACSPNHPVEILILNGGYFYKLALEALPKSNLKQLQIWIIECDDALTVIVYCVLLLFNMLNIPQKNVTSVNVTAAGQTLSESNNAQKHGAADPV